MAKQSTVWLSDKGEVCKSEKDARLVDASDAITHFIEKNAVAGRFDKDDVYQLLTQNAADLRDLLFDYINAAKARELEVMGR